MRETEIEVRHAQRDHVQSPKALEWEVNLTADGVELLATLEEPPGGVLVIPMAPAVATRLYRQLEAWVRTGDRVRGV